MRTGSLPKFTVVLTPMPTGTVNRSSARCSQLAMILGPAPMFSVGVIE